MGWDLGVGMQGKPVDTSTTGTGECGMFPCIAKPRADAPDLLAGPLPKGDALLDGGRQGTGQLGRVITQGVIACGRSRVNARLQVSQPTQRADDPPADLRDDRGNIDIG